MMINEDILVGIIFLLREYFIEMELFRFIQVYEDYIDLKKKIKIDSFEVVYVNRFVESNVFIY